MFLKKNKKKTPLPTPKKCTGQSSYQLNMDPVRYQNEYGLNGYNEKPLCLKIGDKSRLFIDGNWVELKSDHTFLSPKKSIGIQTSKEEESVPKTTIEIQKLIEENNALKIKVKVLLMLLSELKLKSGDYENGLDK